MDEHHRVVTPDAWLKAQLELLAQGKGVHSITGPTQSTAP